MDQNPLVPNSQNKNQYNLASNELQGPKPPLVANNNSKIILGIVALVLISLAALGVYYYFNENGGIPYQSNPTPSNSSGISTPASDNAPDTDKDGMPDKVEEAIGTNLRNADSDGDTYLDLAEIKNGYSPFIAGSAGKYTLEQFQALQDKIKAADQKFYLGVFGGSSSTPSLSDETADWKTYKNEQYGFEVKYPLDFKEQKPESEADLLKVVKSDGGGSYDFGIRLMKNYKADQIVSSIKEVKEINIGNHLGYEYFYTEGVGASDIVLIQVGQDALSIGFNSIGNGQKFTTANDKKTYIQNSLNQILSTFKFIN